MPSDFSLKYCNAVLFKTTRVHVTESEIQTTADFQTKIKLSHGKIIFCFFSHSLKKNLNLSKPSDQSKGLGGDIGCRDKNFTWY